MSRLLVRSGNSNVYHWWESLQSLRILIRLLIFQVPKEACFALPTHPRPAGQSVTDRVSHKALWKFLLAKVVHRIPAKWDMEKEFRWPKATPDNIPSTCIGRSENALKPSSLNANVFGLKYLIRWNPATGKTARTTQIGSEHGGIFVPGTQEYIN